MRERRWGWIGTAGVALGGVFGGSIFRELGYVDGCICRIDSRRAKHSWYELERLM